MSGGVMERVAEWYMAGNTGASSECILSAFLGRPSRWSASHYYPADTGDLARCLQLLDRVPEAREGISRLAARPDAFEWRELDEIWDALTAHGRSDGLLEWRGTFGNGKTTTAELLATALEDACQQRRQAQP